MHTQQRKFIAAMSLCATIAVPGLSFGGYREAPRKTKVCPRVT